MIPESDVPALLGLRSLKVKRAVLDMGANVLWLPGEGDMMIDAPPNSLRLPLSETPSGHLMLPFSKYEELSR
eukprot:1920242-Amphidinium_carterae.1